MNYSPVRQQIVTALRRGLKIRETARLTDSHRDTVMRSLRRLEAAGEGPFQCARCGRPLRHRGPCVGHAKAPTRTIRVAAEIDRTMHSLAGLIATLRGATAEESASWARRLRQLADVFDGASSVERARS